MPPLPLRAIVEVPLPVWHDVKGSKLGLGGMARTLRDLAWSRAHLRLGDGAARAKILRRSRFLRTESVWRTLGREDRSRGAPVNRAAIERAAPHLLRAGSAHAGAGRIFFALVLIGDLLRRVPWLREFYTNAGILPNHTVLWRPPFPRLFSFFFMSSLPEEAALWFAICFVCFFCFLIGWRTRLFHVLSFVMTTSLHNRMLFAENWGGVAIGALMVWTVFLPLGRRFSVDAVLRQPARAAPTRRRSDLAAGRAAARQHGRARRWRCSGCLLQIAIIYWFNFVHKSGRPGRTAARSTTCCTRSGSSPGWGCRCASTSRTR